MNTDNIERGDYVSWRLDGKQRQYGRMVRRTTSEFHPAFIINVGKKEVIVPAKHVTKEVG